MKVPHRVLCVLRKFKKTTTTIKTVDKWTKPWPHSPALCSALRSLCVHRAWNVDNLRLIHSTPFESETVHIPPKFSTGRPRPNPPKTVGYPPGFPIFVHNPVDNRASLRPADAVLARHFPSTGLCSPRRFRALRPLRLPGGFPSRSGGTGAALCAFRRSRAVGSRGVSCTDRRCRR